jgi:cell division septation protein DedD
MLSKSTTKNKTRVDFYPLWLGGLMNVKKLSILLGILTLLALGCSKKKEEAAKLEQEMTQQETAVDTGIDTAAMPVDTSKGVKPKSDIGTTPKYEEKEGYAVQVAACESLDYAQYLLDKYSQRGYEPYLTTTTVDGQTYYRVRIGGIATLTEAKDLKDELQDKYSVQAWIEEIK